MKWRASRWIPSVFISLLALATGLNAQQTDPKQARDLQFAVSRQFDRPYVEARTGSNAAGQEIARIVITDSVVFAASPDKQVQAAREVAAFVLNHLAEDEHKDPYLIIVGWSWSEAGRSKQVIQYEFFTADLGRSPSSKIN